MSIPEDNENPLEENTNPEEKSDTIERFDGILNLQLIIFNFYLISI